MSDDNKIKSRKQFIGLGISAAAVLAALRFWPVSKKKKEKTKTVTMLMQDGKLVQVEVAALPQKKKKITNKELQHWITKNISNN